MTGYVPRSARQDHQYQREWDRTGVVDFEGVHRRVGLAWVPEARVGDYVIVHVGHAISRLDPEEAQRTLEAFRELSQAMGAADSEK